MMKLIRALVTHKKEDLMGLRPWRKHSQVLSVAGLVYVAYGASLLLVGAPKDRIQSLSLAADWMPLSTWGLVWVGTGLMSIASSRWPPASETWGYSTMSALAALWAAFYALSMIFLEAPLTGIAGALVWSMVAYMWWAISGLRNPDDVITLPLGEVVMLQPPSQSDTDEEP
jgi:hypothetical protein